MNLLLDLKQIDQRLMDHTVSPMAIPPQQTSKGIFHFTSDCGEDMGLYRRQVDDIHANHWLGDEQTIRKYLFQN